MSGLLSRTDSRPAPAPGVARDAAAPPRFSIVTVTRNDLEGLKATCRSIAGQGFQGLEWIVVDGASTDATAGWLAQASVTVPWHWTSEPDAGIYDAMNKGIERARGDYLIFMNSGDTFPDDRVLDRIAAEIAAADGPIDFLFGDAYDRDRDGAMHYRAARDAAWRRVGMFTHHQAMVFRRGALNGLHYDPSHRYSADYAFVCTFLGADRPIRKVGFPICTFLLGGEHDLHRVAAIREDWRVRRTVLRQPLPVRVALASAAVLHHLLKRVAPGVTGRFRYGPRR